MANVRIELDTDGLWDLLRSEEIKQVCKEHADNIQRRAGAGYKTDTYTGIHRVNASVGPETKEAIKDNLENNTLLKALRG